MGKLCKMQINKDKRKYIKYLGGLWLVWGCAVGRVFGVKVEIVTSGAGLSYMFLEFCYVWALFNIIYIIRN